MTFDPACPILNLEGVIADIEAGDAGQVDIDTIRRVQGQIEVMRRDLMCAEDAYIALRRAFGERK